jgi:hypothetical protein
VNGRWTAPASVLGGLALGAAVVPAAGYVGTDVPWAIALVAGLVAGALLAIGLGTPATDPLPPEDERPPGPDTNAGLGDLGVLEFTLDGASRDPERFETRVRPQLARLAVDRIWHARGLDWHTPEGRAAAEQVVGPHTRALLTQPPGSLRLTPQALSDWTEELEQL